MLADDLESLVALEAAGALIPAPHDALRIDHVDRIICDRIDKQSASLRVTRKGFETVRFLQADVTHASSRNAKCGVSFLASFGSRENIAGRSSLLGDWHGSPRRRAPPPDMDRP